MREHQHDPLWKCWFHLHSCKLWPSLRISV